nr:CbiX/SirB N-terminal domain-containing protein [Cohnella sp. WQ 127256]
MVISHGSRDTGWVILVEAAIEAVREALGTELVIEAAFLELVDGRLIQDGLDRLEAAGVDRILAIPLFVSTGSTHVDEIGWALGAYPSARTETDLERFSVKGELTYGKPMDDAPEIVDVLLDRLREVSMNPAQESILLVGHGSQEAGFKEEWERNMASLMERLVEQGGYGDCAGALLLLDQVSERWELLRSRQPNNEILVIPLFLSEGYFTKQVIPQRLNGLACRYDGRTYMPHPRIADWIARQSKEWLIAVS